MRRILRDNGLSIVLFILFILALCIGQSLTGHAVYNQEQQEHGGNPIPFSEYLGNAHFLEATMENWESEFLQMALYVMLTAFLYQKGSSESKKPGEKEAVDRDPRRSKHRKDAPWPVRTGGLILKLYEHSLFLAFMLLFFLSFWLHAVGGAGDFNEQQLQHGGQTVSTLGYVGTSRFWFESLQNWQSEFLAIFAMVVLPIFLRQRGSPESKPVDAPHSQTGSEEETGGNGSLNDVIDLDRLSSDQVKQLENAYKRIIMHTANGKKRAAKKRARSEAAGD